MKKLRKKFNERDYSREKLKVLKLLDSVTLFDDAGDTDRVERCRTDFWAFAHTYLSHYFSSPKQAEWHGDAFNTIHGTVCKVSALAAPRGEAKSTTFSFAYYLWRVLYQTTRFAVLEMDTLPKAEMQTWRILLELLYNPRILHDFGKIVSEESARGDFTTIVNESRPHPIRLLAFGAGMSARGLINAQFRPDLWGCDDVETRQIARNPKRVEQLEDIVLADNLGAMCAGDWTFFIIGTIICRGSFLDKCMKNEAFVRRKFRAIENMGLPDERSTWPELHPLQNLYVLLGTMGRNRFMAEKQNEPLETGGYFEEQWFRFFKELPAEIDRSRFIDQVDPSFSDIGDHKACFIMAQYEHHPKRRDWLTWCDTKGKPFEEGLYHLVIDPYNRKASIDELVKAWFDRFKKWHPFRIAIDGSFSQKITFRRELQRIEIAQGYTLPVKFTDQARNKETKIVELQPMIERGLLIFADDGSKDLEQTIIQFTRFKEPGIPDDGPDAIAEGIETLKRASKKAKVTMV